MTVKYEFKLMTFVFFLLDPVREGADNFLGEIGGVASWSVGAEVSG